MYHYGVPREIGTDGKDDPQSWDYTFNPIGRDKTEEAKIHLLTKGGYSNTIGFAMAWLDMDGPDEDQTDGKGVTETIRLLEEHKDKPFFIGMGFFRPHTPWIAPKKYYDLYPLGEIKLPKRDARRKGACRRSSREDPSRQLWAEREGPEGLRARLLRGVSFVDAQVGRLLDTVDAARPGRQHADRLLVAITASCSASTGSGRSSCCSNPPRQVPLIIYDPSAKGNGKVCDRTGRAPRHLSDRRRMGGAREAQEPRRRAASARCSKCPQRQWDHPAYSQVTRGKPKKPR